jgi:cytochrome c oxidase subunit 3
MGLLRALTEKPWLIAQDKAERLAGGEASPAPTARLGLKFLLAAMSMLFFLLAVAYVHRMELADWRPMPEPWLLWLNTGVLVLSSAGLQWAWVGARSGRIDNVKIGLQAGGALALIFLAGQLLAWKQFSDLGYFSAANPANAFFYLITGVHGVHLSGGLVALGRTAAKVWGDDELVQIRLSVELCAVYWHFLLAVWLVLFALMLFT